MVPYRQFSKNTDMPYPLRAPANLNTFSVWLMQLVVAVAYLLSGVIIHHMFKSSVVASAIWPGSGLALTALLIGGRRFIWGVFFGSLLLNALSQDSLFVIGGMTLANVLEALLGYLLLSRHERLFIISLSSLSGYLMLIVWGGCVASLLGAFIGSSTLLLAGFAAKADYLNVALHWWMGDMLGVTLFTPWILTWWQPRSTKFMDKQLFGGLLLVGMTFAISQIVFLGWLEEYVSDTPKGYLMFLCVSWIAIRLDNRWVTFAVIMIAIQALFGAYKEVGFFAHDIAKAALFNFWAYILILSMVGTTISTYISEIRRKEEQLRDNATRFQTILNSMSEGLHGIGRDGEIIFENPAATAMLGRDAQEMLGQSAHILMHHTRGDGSPYPPSECHIYATLNDGAPRHITDEVFWRKDGTSFPVDYISTSMRNAAGEIIGAVVSFRDITERMRAEENLRITASVFDNSQEAILINDANNNIIDANPAFTRITGYLREEVLGRNPKLLSSGRQDKTFYALMWQSLSQKKAWRGEIWNRRKSGEVYAEQLSISAICDNNDNVLRYVAVFSDISHVKEHEAELSHIAHYDALTGIPNRVLLADRMRQAIAQTARENNMMAVCYLDLDGFKPVNDTLGHEAGDQVLIEVAKRIGNTIRGGDTVARLGGDEFVALLLGQKKGEDCLAMLERLLTVIAQPIDVKGQFVTLGASVGVSIYPRDEENPDILIRQADRAMYEAKQSGKNRFNFYDLELDKYALDQPGSSNSSTDGG